jgi:hypothetical protein
MTKYTVPTGAEVSENCQTIFDLACFTIRKIRIKEMKFTFKERFLVYVELKNERMKAFEITTGTTY